MRRALLLAGFLLGACGHPADVPPEAPDAILVGKTCQSAYGWTLQVEVGAAEVTGASPLACDAIGSFLYYLGAYEGLYVAKWGRVDLTGWTVRVRANRNIDQKDALPGYFVAGATYFDQRTIDIYQGALVVFPHELRHVALGPASYDHHGWCSDGFSAWEMQTLSFDERAYLGCQ